MRGVALFVLLLTMVGCVTKQTGAVAQEDELPRFIPGRTTRRDVVARWGNPDRMKGNVWTWRDWRLVGGKFKLGYWGVGFTVENTRASTREYHLTFDERGCLLSKEVIDSIPGGSSWSLNPWD